MELRSSGFRNGTTIPRRFTCDGEDMSPPLEWSGAPAGVRGACLGRALDASEALGP